MTMLEKAAKAAYEAHGDAGLRMPPWEMLPADHPLRVRKISEVRATLEAIREPRGIVADAAYAAMGSNESVEAWAMERWMTEKAWPTIIDAILGEKP